MKEKYQTERYTGKWQLEATEITEYDKAGEAVAFSDNPDAGELNLNDDGLFTSLGIEEIAPEGAWDVKYWGKRPALRLNKSGSLLNRTYTVSKINKGQLHLCFYQLHSDGWLQYKYVLKFKVGSGSATNPDQVMNGYFKYSDSSGNTITVPFKSAIITNEVFTPFGGSPQTFKYAKLEFLLDKPSPVYKFIRMGICGTSAGIDTGAYSYMSSAYTRSVRVCTLWDGVSTTSGMFLLDDLREFKITKSEIDGEGKWDFAARAKYYQFNKTLPSIKMPRAYNVEIAFKTKL